jgi:hypothetical protein
MSDQSSGSVKESQEEGLVTRPGPPTIFLGRILTSSSRTTSTRSDYPNQKVPALPGTGPYKVVDSPRCSWCIRRTSSTDARWSARVTMPYYRYRSGITGGSKGSGLGGNGVAVPEVHLPSAVIRGIVQSVFAGGSLCSKVVTSVSLIVCVPVGVHRSLSRSRVLTSRG